MSRRPPIKIRQTAAETSPEAADVKRRLESSAALQARLRSQRHDADGPQAPEAAPKAGELVVPPADKMKPEALENPPAPEASAEGQGPAGQGENQSSPKGGEASAPPNEAPGQRTARPPRPSAPADSDGQRIAVRVIVDLDTENSMKEAATKLKQGRDYVAKAMLVKARAALIARMKDNTLAVIAPEARLLLDKWQDRGTKGLATKITVGAGDLADMRGFYNDPLGLLSDNAVVAAFVGAELKRLVKDL